MNVASWIVASALAVAASGCGPDFTDYYPLQVGNTWQYKTRYPDGRGRIDKDQVIRRVESTYYFNNGEILILLGDQALVNRNGLRVLAHPLSLGHRWEDRDVRFEIVSVGAAVKVPAGEFADTMTVVWKATRRAPITQSGEAFAEGVPPARAEDVPPPILEAEKQKEYPLRDFVTTVVYAKGVGPIAYRLDAALAGEKPENVLISELQSWSFPKR
jgi:hypothetical protein